MLQQNSYVPSMNLESIRVFMSMPYMKGLTPVCLEQKGRFEVYSSENKIERRHGIFKINEAGLSPLDHGGLYGDACFEGILIKHGRIILFREHLLRWYQSAEKLSIKHPYSIQGIAKMILETVRKSGLSKNETGYIRAVLTRGIGSLGIEPNKCIEPTIYCIVSTISLYPDEAYKTGLDISVARKIRRPDNTIINPNIKSNNYLNNILALLEVQRNGYRECIMLSRDGFLAEATVENLFIIKRVKDWQVDPSSVYIYTPSTELCLVGITRNIVIQEALKLGYTVKEMNNLLPSDLLGSDTECFMTGTGCGLMPIVKFDGTPIADGSPGFITRLLIKRINMKLADPSSGLSVDSNQSQIETYFS